MSWSWRVAASFQIMPLEVVGVERVSSAIASNRLKDGCVQCFVVTVRIRQAPMSWLRTRSANRIIVDHSGKEYFHHIHAIYSQMFSHTLLSVLLLSHSWTSVSKLFRHATYEEMDCVDAVLGRFWSSQESVQGIVDVRMEIKTPRFKDDTVFSSPDGGYLDPCRQRDSQR